MSAVQEKNPQLKFASVKEARRYVYAILVPMLAHELTPEACEGWMFCGVDKEPDDRRLRKAIKNVMVEMRRKADAP